MPNTEEIDRNQLKCPDTNKENLELKGNEFKSMIVLNLSR